MMIQIRKKEKLEQKIYSELMAQAYCSSDPISNSVFKYIVYIINLIRCKFQSPQKSQSPKKNVYVKNKTQKENTKAMNPSVFFQTSCQGQWVLLKG